MATRFLRGKAKRNALWLAAGGKCQMCGCDLPEEWHADHIEPYCKTGRTNVHEMQALCASCNQKKGSSSVNGLRKHQKELFDILSRATPDYLREMGQIIAHVWPGGGKSALPVVAGHILRQKGFIDSIAIVVPRLSLKRQGALAFLDERWRSLLGHNMEVREAGNDANPARGSAGYITTYDAIRLDGAGIHSPGVHQDFFRNHRVLLCLDEVHHVALGEKTHKMLRPLYEMAAFRLLLTGTIDRNKQERVAFLDYAAPDIEGNEFPEIDISYKLSDAIAEKAIIPAEFHHYDGEVTYIDKGGQQVWLGTLTTEDEDCRDGIYAALKTAYAQQLLEACVRHWQKYRETHPRSLLLVVCAGKKQASTMQTLLASRGIESLIATSDDSESAQAAIKSFRENGKPHALVTVQMAYEGMDVPAITHVACLTHIRSMPWLMQMFGRATRHDPLAGPWKHQKAFIFTPDDPLMQKAIDYVRNEEAIGVDALEEEEEETSSPSSSSSSPEVIETETNCVVPLDGATTRHRASSIWEEEDLGYEETAKIKSLIDKHSLGASVIDVANLLRELQVDLASITSSDQPKQQRPQSTQREREDALRKSIQELCTRMDARQNKPFGTWNAKAFNEIQHYRKREDLNENELTSVWKWCCEHAQRIGLDPLE